MSGKENVLVRNTMITKVNSFWTNFKDPHNYKFNVLPYDPETPDYWKFETNLDYNDVMSMKKLRAFLWTMKGYYYGG